MDEHTRDRGKWPALLLGLLLAIAGVALAVGGGQLLMLGGSAYYLIAGVAVVVAGLLLALRKGAALWLYALILFATLVWALWEVGLDWWQLVPSSLSDLRLMDELRRGFFTPPVLVLVLVLVLLCGS
ncbi:hypothetical protein HAALTHF_51590n [Vreelandella aquamarina]|nr:hypothetical protein HAALTHF_51590n [Halomonas axialensis]